MGRIVNAGEAARLCGVSDRTMRQWLADGKIQGAEKVQRIGKPATWRIDTDSLPERSDDAPPVGDAEKIAELERQVDELKRQVTLLAGVRSSPYVPSSASLPSPSSTPALDAPPSPSLAPRPRRVPYTRPLAQSTHTRGMRTHRLYSQYWRTDAREAVNGLMLFQTFAKLCGMRKETIESHVHRENLGELEHIGLGFTRLMHEDGKTRLRYLDAGQRAQWARYWQHLGYSITVPDEETITADLGELALWDR